MSNELIDAPKSAIAEYKTFYAQLAELESNNTALVFDYESKKGNKEARSHVFSLRKSSAELERTRVAAKAESLKIGRLIDSEAKEISARIAAMIDVHQVKIDEIEKRETDRIHAIQCRIGAIEAAVPMLETIGSEDLAAGIAALELVAIDDSFAEFLPVAVKAKDARLIKLRETLAVIKAREAEAKELARLRAESEARAQKDRDDAIAKAAADKATADAAALAERTAAQARQAAADAEAKAKADRDSAERRELQLKLDAENAERRRLESEKKAAQDKIDAAAKAEADKQQAIQQEKANAARIERVAAEEKARREADTAHRGSVNRAALAALVAGGISEECAKDCIKLIASGKVPSITINY